ncbi:MULTISPECIES: LemA family protein [Myroides]|uniref:LemA family protein n=1 Tax=Myroides albus TaxID=2562892 RepID=A0A6I3LNS0_9FLAO|nr:MULTISPECIES: LemA family protein [Myroides]MTG99086.1 LemA family protein [Myroides albus]MVX36247.1 LemA family protein [Myroides sp. LoEW2-1]UVD80705.1 LemA family protein [Myroides albus]
MKKALVPIIVLVVVIAGIFMYSVGIKNDIVALSQTEQKQWADVQAAYQRRNDLIGNLVKTVQGAADFEKGTLEAVVKARAEATKVTIDPSNMTPEQLENFNQVQSNVASSLSKLLVVSENYPELKTNTNFLKLQDELASTENTIQTQRVRFNSAIMDYNGYILKFPNSVFAGMYGYKEKPYFNAVQGADKPVEVEFNF